MGFLDNIFCDDNNILLIIILVLVVVLLLSNDGCGFNFGKFNFGDNWLLILIVLFVVFGDGLDIF